MSDGILGFQIHHRLPSSIVVIKKKLYEMVFSNIEIVNI